MGVQSGVLWRVNIACQAGIAIVKYFFLSEGWILGRVWEFGGLWNEAAWRRPPDIQRLNLYIRQDGETLWLYRAEDAVLMVEVLPDPQRVAGAANSPTIGNVVLKRLITADQAIEHLAAAMNPAPPH